MITALYIYILGVLLAYMLLTYNLRKFLKRHEGEMMFVFIPNEHIQYLALLSWIIVAGFAVAWLIDKLTVCYVYILFKYKLWKNEKDNNNRD